jgi:phospholipid-binding lipoprotein MlaA
MLAALSVGAATGAGGDAHAQEATRDPFEKFNRGVYAFNEVIDRYGLEPIAKGYRAVTPQPFREGVGNVLHNLRAPVTFANDVLQGAPRRAGTTVARFGINSTIGVVGIFDVASTMGLEKHSEDFGQTLGRWGVPTGPYLVLPLLGPSTVRDTGGAVVDIALNPINYAQFEGDDIFRATRTTLTVVNGRAAAIEAIQSIRDTSIDPYVSIRTTYLILRESAVRNGQTNVQDLPEFEEIPPEAGTDAGSQPTIQAPQPSATPAAPPSTSAPTPEPKPQGN